MARKKTDGGNRKSTLEQQFDTLWGMLATINLTPVDEHYFARPRRWRFDKAWIDQRVAVELEGAIWTDGRHSRGSGMIGDMDKYNTAAVMGWIVLRYSGNHLDKDPAAVIAQVEQALRQRMTSISSDAQRAVSPVSPVSPAKPKQRGLPIAVHPAHQMSLWGDEAA